MVSTAPPPAHVADLVDGTEGHEEAGPVLVVHDVDGGVSDPRVTAQMIGVRAGHVAAVLRVPPRRLVGLGAVVVVRRRRGTGGRHVVADAHLVAVVVSDVGRRIAARATVRAGPRDDGRIRQADRGLLAAHADPPVGARCGHRLDLVPLLADVGDDRARELVVQVVTELGVVHGLDELEVVGGPEVADGHDLVRAVAEDVLGVADRLVRPAHVPWVQAADHDVVADDRFRGHVADPGVRVVDAPVLEPEHVLHVVLLGVARLHLVHDHEHHPGRLCRQRGARGDE